MLEDSNAEQENPKKRKDNSNLPNVGQFKKMKKSSDIIDYNSIREYLFKDVPTNKYQEQRIDSLRNEEQFCCNFLSLLTAYANLFSEYTDLSIFSKNNSQVQKFINTVQEQKCNFLKIYEEILETSEKLCELTTNMRGMSTLFHPPSDQVKVLQEKLNLAKINLLNLVAQMSGY